MSQSQIFYDHNLKYIIGKALLLCYILHKLVVACNPGKKINPKEIECYDFDSD